MQPNESFWNLSAEALFRELDTSASGLSSKEAATRLCRKAPSGGSRKYKDLRLLLAQYKSPLVLLLVFAVGLSLLLHEYSDSLIVLIVLLLTEMLVLLVIRTRRLFFKSPQRRTNWWTGSPDENQNKSCFLLRESVCKSG
ncbi:hypothetical protein V9K67_15355 [Paraflavisolibacter sp. H34]|uniref:hypothetical protein n=1 Tax=Huijunlia imazamoxiresistens TaxID=3127457 RepID=UPI003018A4E2